MNNGMMSHYSDVSGGGVLGTFQHALSCAGGARTAQRGQEGHPAVRVDAHVRLALAGPAFWDGRRPGECHSYLPTPWTDVFKFM